MDNRILRLGVIVLATTLIITACASKPATPSIDTVATAVAQAASRLLTETAAAAPRTPTPKPSSTPKITDTANPGITATPLYTAPLILNTAGCYFGPGPTYTLESNISKGKRVELLGVGSVSGWYIIRNPYFHRPCWIEAVNLKIYEGINVAELTVMTPGVPLPGK